MQNSGQFQSFFTQKNSKMYRYFFYFSCRARADVEEVKEKALKDEIPYCQQCGGFVKPDIVFFGENLPSRFFQLQETDTTEADLLICIGTSLEVYPFANIAELVDFDIPRILINREKVGSFGSRKNDIILLGSIVEIVEKIQLK